MEITPLWVGFSVKRRSTVYTRYVNEILDTLMAENWTRVDEMLSGFSYINEYMSKHYPKEYLNFPKGYTFFWMGFLLFKAKKYDHAIFYLDAAMAEDKRYMVKETNSECKTVNWKDSGAALFFRLYEYTGRFQFFNMTELKFELKNLLEGFNKDNLEKYQIELETDFIDHFIRKYVEKSNTAIITTLYSFIMEKKDIDSLMTYRSNFGGTLEPMLMHLVKGTLLFESLVKFDYEAVVLSKTGEKHVTLGNIFYDSDFKVAMGYGGTIKTSSTNLENIMQNGIGKKLKKSFQITAQIRNTSAHSLNWDENFLLSYDKMYRNIAYSIFYYIYKQYIEKQSPN